MKHFLRILWLFLLVSCARNARTQVPGAMEYAQWFDLSGNGVVVVHSPYGAPDDTLAIDGPVRSIVCMSSSYIGFLDALGCDSVVTAVSGLDYVSDPEVRAAAEDVGYDAALDYETILGLHPDLLVTYAVSAAEPPYLAKLRDLGIRTVIIHEHLESHPLARAEYIKLFGALTGRLGKADSVFVQVRDHYLSLVREMDAPRKVLVNIPYADQWYIPGGDNYMTRLIHDAGGEVLGAVAGRFESSIISVEKAFEYAQEADFWLNPGWCSTKDQLRSVHPLFADFPVLAKSVWNNTKQSTPGGGNAFWETGPAHPDLILEDLRAIFDGTSVPGNYYLPVL
ncbi:MAG: ABC transporter substrate-binding protein [Bacteroidales bacterium]|nr:ABC transporter substrate-binding protein [Bacteroidales bacterium]